MIDIQEYIGKLDELKKKFEWFINGMFIHCLPIRHVGIPSERICELYNVDISFFKPKKL